MPLRIFLPFLFGSLIAWACAAEIDNPTPSPAPTQWEIENTPTQPGPTDGATNDTVSTMKAPTGKADVSSVSVSGEPGRYTFRVEISSPDEGCDQYADWWEVLTPDGELLYRRILLHSHVAEQPFTRSGGPVNIGANDEVMVRAHMNNSSYGGAAMRGSPAGGFDPFRLDPGDFSGLESQPPLPDGCDF